MKQRDKCKICWKVQANHLKIKRFETNSGSVGKYWANTLNSGKFETNSWRTKKMKTIYCGRGGKSGPNSENVGILRTNSGPLEIFGHTPEKWQVRDQQWES